MTAIFNSHEYMCYAMHVMLAHLCCSSLIKHLLFYTSRGIYQLYGPVLFVL